MSKPPAASTDPIFRVAYRYTDDEGRRYTLTCKVQAPSYLAAVDKLRAELTGDIEFLGVRE